MHISVVSVFASLDDLDEAESVVRKVGDRSGLLTDDRRTHTKTLEYMLRYALHIFIVTIPPIPSVITRTNTTYKIYIYSFGTECATLMPNNNASAYSFESWDINVRRRSVVNEARWAWASASRYDSADPSKKTLTRAGNSSSANHKAYV